MPGAPCGYEPPRERQDLDRLRDKLAKGWAAGLSTRQIGARLGLSKGATIGIIARARAHGDGRFRPRPISSGRDHLKGEPKPKVRKLKPVDEAGNRKPPPPAPPKLDRTFSSARKHPPEPRVLIDLDWQDCRWSTGAAPDGRHLFCGAPQAPGRPYCERHCGAVRSESTSPSASARGSR